MDVWEEEKVLVKEGEEGRIRGGKKNVGGLRRDETGKERKRRRQKGGKETSEPSREGEREESEGKKRADEGRRKGEKEGRRQERGEVSVEGRERRRGGEVFRKIGKERRS